MNKEKLENRIISIIAVVLMVGAAFTLGFFAKGWTMSDTVRELENVLELIEENYVGEFDREEFIAAAVSGSLDKYSTYYSPVKYEEVELSKDGISQGKMGIGFAVSSSGIIVYSVEGNSPAERAGITVGGKVVSVKRVGEQEFIDIKDYDDWSAFYNTLKKDEQVVVKILYETEETFTLAKENYNVSYVWYQDSTGGYNFTFDVDRKEWKLVQREKPLKTHVNEGFAYVKLSGFSGNACAQLILALGKMKENGNDKLILDLRSNGGGYMDVLEDIAGHLIPGKDKQCVSKAVYKNGDEEGFYTSKNYYDGYGYKKITVLANSGTASASEALIGAILDYDEAEDKNIASVIVEKTQKGSTTYGKGIMQTTYSFPSGSALKITTANICWPLSNVCVHDVGITPELDDRVSAVEMLAGEDSMLLAAMA